MFGRRADGRRLDDLDPIIQITPYIMKTRNDAMVNVTINIDYEPLADYIKKRAKEGKKVSFQSIIMAAYVRTIAEYPQLNRFIMNKQIFARNDIITSLTVLRNAGDKENLDEATIKMHFKADATVDEVTDEIARLQKDAVNAEADNGAVDFVSKLIKMRILVQGVVWFARFMDRYGLLPRFIYDISPFHCSMFLTNMASINMPPVYHHLYNFGNTSVFIAVGKYEKTCVNTKEGVKSKLILPLKITIDERICGGAGYAIGVQYFERLLKNPEQLEQRPERVVTETKMIR